MDKETLRFIDKLYKDLYKSPDVLHHSTGNETDKFRNIKEYIDNLERIHSEAAKNKERIKTLKRMYYDRYVIKREDVPESYYELQKRMALERGFGHVELTDDIRERVQDEAIENQKASLDNWLDYFLSDDAKVYPFWAKYWAFQGMTKLGLYDKQAMTFNKRTKDTCAPFPELNREALSTSIDFIIKLIEKKEFEDEELERIVESGSFQKIYPYVLGKILTNSKNIVKRNEGRWVKYDQGSDHMELVNSIKGFNTGWCTAGENTAEVQLSLGDFYVFYTLDENNEYKVPRIAIRMEGNRIGEIRGIDESQNIEPGMEKVVEEKIKDFPDKEAYYKKVHDMEKLTEIYNKNRNNQELTPEELRFLYEVDSKIIGFGYGDDPRIEELLEGRNLKKDLSKVFNCKESQIIDVDEKIIPEDAIYCRGDIINDELTISNRTYPKYVYGNVKFEELESIENVKLPLHIGGELYMECVHNMKNVELPITIGDDLSLTWLEEADGVRFPEYIGGSLDLNSVKKIKNSKLPKYVGGNIDLSWLENADGVEFPEFVGGNLDLYSVKSAKGTKLPNIVGACLYMGIESAEHLHLPRSIGSVLALPLLKDASNLELPENLGGIEFSWLNHVDHLKIPKDTHGTVKLGLSSCDGLELPEDFKFNLELLNLKSARGLNLPKKMRGDLDLGTLDNINGLVLPEEIDGELSMPYLFRGNGLVLPRKLKSLSMVRLQSAEGIKFPDYVSESINLNNLNTPKGLNLPDYVGSSIYLYTLPSVEGIKFPSTLGGYIYLPEVYDFSGLDVSEEIKNKITLASSPIDAYRKMLPHNL